MHEALEIVDLFLRSFIQRRAAPILLAYGTSSVRRSRSIHKDNNANLKSANMVAPLAAGVVIGIASLFASWKLGGDAFNKVLTPRLLACSPKIFTSIDDDNLPSIGSTGGCSGGSKTDLSALVLLSTTSAFVPWCQVYGQLSFTKRGNHEATLQGEHSLFSIQHTAKPGRNNCLVLPMIIFHYAGNHDFAPGACDRVEPYLFSEMVGQELAVQQACDAICDHLAQQVGMRPHCFP